MASEAGHWYTREGAPAYTTIGKNGKERATTIRDAREHGYLPSVTTIIRCASSFGLERWKAEQLLMAGLTLPKQEGETEADWIGRVWEDSKQQAIKAAERGMEIHAAVESYFCGDDPGAVLMPHVKATHDTIKAAFGEPRWSPEESFADNTLGFGGKVDLHAPGVVVDFKTKDGDLSKVQEYDEHRMQLAAYAMGLGYPEARCGIVFISRTEPRAVAVEIAPDEVKRGWRMFEALLTYWKASNL